MTFTALGSTGGIYAPHRAQPSSAELAASGLIVVADNGYTSTSEPISVP
jgi:hypothetical protein